MPKPVSGGSLSVILLVKAECPSSRMRAPEYHQLAADVARAGVAWKVVVLSGHAATAHYARLLPPNAPVAADTTGRVARRLRIRRVPGLCVLERERPVRCWSPFTYDPETRGELASLLRARGGSTEALMETPKTGSTAERSGSEPYPWHRR